MEKYSEIIRDIVRNPHQLGCPLCDEMDCRMGRKVSCYSCPAQTLGYSCQVVRDVLRHKTDYYVPKTEAYLQLQEIQRRGAEEMALELALACELAGD